jgi:tetratricopeptide (TPR) repeat protein
VTEGISIEGSVRNSAINNTVNQQDPAVLAAIAKTFVDQIAATTEAKSQAEARAAELATKFGFTSAAVGEFFKILGEQNVPEEKVPARLIEIATHFAQTRDELATLEPDDPRTAELARSAKEALDSGRLIEADTRLDEAKEAELSAFRQARELKQKAQTAEHRHALNAAKLIAGRGNIALTQLRYADAAENFRQAATLVPPGHSHERGSYLYHQADALYREGDERGDNVALRQSIQTWHLMLQERALIRMPLPLATIRNNLGMALARLGERERGGSERLEEAVRAFRSALTEVRHDRLPLQWAVTQVNLGVALSALGEREAGTAHLAEAVAAYRAGLEEQRRDRIPLQWAMTQMNLGHALFRLGEREPGTARLEEAVAAYRAALEEYTRDRVPLQWAAAQHNLGHELGALGEREAGTAHLEEAVAAYRAALEERRRDRVPLDWAASTGDQGVALRLLAERLDDSITAQIAVQQVEVALVVMQEGGNAPAAMYYKAQLPKAQDLLDRLTRR